eukprot:TRINITY_DN2011_c0_g1_i1.p1 TRINITY_DN2011_c0_g1~~TRINITY_DN2011_c0_g1_i1.p1  ORF type:complete len:464 (+),score=254.27 TRINITY_DN2011_c0_g1_i1:186-1394(+)
MPRSVVFGAIVAVAVAAGGVAADDGYEGCGEFVSELIALTNPNPRAWSKDVSPSAARAARLALQASPSKAVQARLCRLGGSAPRVRSACESFVAQYGLARVTDMTVNELGTVCSHWAGRPLQGSAASSTDDARVAAAPAGDVLVGGMATELEALELLSRHAATAEDQVDDEADDNDDEDEEEHVKVTPDDDDEDDEEEDDDDDEEDDDTASVRQAALAELSDIADAADHESAPAQMWGNKKPAGAGGAAPATGAGAGGSASARGKSSARRTTRKTTTTRRVVRRRSSSSSKKSRGRRSSKKSGTTTEESLKGIEGIIGKSVSQLPLTHHMLKMRMMQETAGVSGLIHQLNVQHYMADPSCVDKDDAACQTAGLMDGINYLSQQTSMPMGGLFGMAGPPDGSV